MCSWVSRWLWGSWYPVSGSGLGECRDIKAAVPGVGAAAFFSWAGVLDTECLGV